MVSESAAADLRLPQLRSDASIRYLPGKNPAAFLKAARPVKVLVIGDSLSFGPFGEALEGFLRKWNAASDVCLFASCGSSPEHWLKTTSDFMTPCGYRESTPDRTTKVDFSNGHRPRLARTPKIPEILARFSPQIVVVQLGTNWMDSLPATAGQNGEAHKQIIREFIKELRAQSPPPARIAWVMPPESSKYSATVKGEVDRWITECAQELGFQTILSRRMTGKYVPGKTGGDGVHYGDADAEKWAKGVNWLLFVSGPD
jgi:hypothetical protein